MSHFNYQESPYQVVDFVNAVLRHRSSEAALIKVVSPHSPPEPHGLLATDIRKLS
jgi:hypothetical protein